MKKLLIFLCIFLSGFVSSIILENFIPTNYKYGQTYGCFKDKGMKVNGEQVIFMPQAYVYNANPNYIPHFVGLMTRGWIPSYGYLFALLTKEIEELPQEECNQLTGKFIEEERVHWKDIFDDEQKHRK